jgi:hypothetical protein
MCLDSRWKTPSGSRVPVCYRTEPGPVDLNPSLPPISAATDSSGACDRCLVAPHPELRERMKRQEAGLLARRGARETSLFPMPRNPRGLQRRGCDSAFRCRIKLGTTVNSAGAGGTSAAAGEVERPGGTGGFSGRSICASTFAKAF